MLRRLAALTGPALAVAAAVAPAPTAAAPSDLANACVRIDGRPGPVYVKPTGLRTAMLHDTGGRLLRPDGDGGATAAGRAETADRTAEWSIRPAGRGRYDVRATAGGARLGDGPVKIRPATGCTPFPEAQLGVTGPSADPTRRDGTVYGYADTHLHVTADLRAGGAVISGKAYDRFGIARALGGDAAVHGPDGGLDHTGNLLRDGVPFGTHDTGGWPSFAGWPTYDTNTHQQTYYAWLQRAWRSGLRLIVAEAIEDTQICHLEPRHVTPCDETKALRGQIARLRGLQDYVDAQAGGRGRGWFRLVYGPREARRVIEQGKLAVVIGFESSFPLGCRAEAPRRCTPAQVDRRLDELHRLGVRSLFIAHWADNGFAGAALQGGVKGKFINAMQRLETGRWFDAEPCPPGVQGEPVEPLSDLEIDVVSQFFPAAAPLKEAERPAYPSGPLCNARGLTRLGAHLVRAMIERHMLIEVDHLSQAARDQVLDIAERARYPVVSGHNGTGGAWTDEELTRLAALGGIASQTPEDPAAMARQIDARTRYRAPRRWFGVGIGTDTGGFATLPGPPADAASNPLRYPFRLDGGPARFARQRTGERVFDLNADGMAHYGLLPDLLADMERRPGGRRAVDLVFRSAEAYLRMWELAERAAR